MDNKTEVVIFHDLAEVIVNNSKALVWVGTQTFTIRHLDEEEADAINSTNTTQEPDQSQDTNTSSVSEESPPNSDSIPLNSSLPDDDDDDDCLLVPMRTNGSWDSNGDTCNASPAEKNNNDEILLLDDDDDDVSASDTVHSLSSSSSNDGTYVKTHLPRFGTNGAAQPNVCTICSKVFSSEYNKKRHQLSHFGIKPYKCNFCAKVFAQSSSYYAHKCSANSSGVSLPPPVAPLKKTQSKMLVCSACGKAFPGIYKLKRHEISHTGEKPYRCEVCQRAFTQWTGMSRHNCPGKVIDKDKIPPSCEECGKIFKNTKYLAIHRQIHKFDGRSDVDDKDIDQAFISTDLEIETTMDASDFIREMFC